MPLFALIAILLAAVPASQPPRTHATASPTPTTLSPDEIFSRRALRRARLIIQMRMFQLRDQRLECVREALLRRLPDALWPEVPTPSRGTPDAAAAISRCDRLLNF
ncbi:MAG: hypothetical protein WAL67_06110 [Candidatus Cybelea sp.]